MIIAIDIRESCAEKTGKGGYTYNLIKAILSQDKQNQYLLYSDNEVNPFKDSKNARVKIIKTSSWKWHFKVLKDLQNEKVDLFFAPTSYIIPAFAPKSLKVIITVHDLVAFLFPSTHNTKATFIERLTLKKALKKADSVFVVSENTKKDLLKKIKYPENKIHITPCAPADFFKQPVKPKELEEIKQKYHLPNRFILAVGTLEPRKNFSTLIKSFIIVKRKDPDLKLVIVGKKGWKFKQVEESVKHYKLQSEVIFPGYIEDHELQKVYHLASVFVFPSLYEGFGIPPLEAMASGCPVISSNVASLPEVIGEAGLLIDPRSSYKIADAIYSLSTNDHARNLLIEKGKIQAGKFSWEESANKALEIFKRVFETLTVP